MTPATPQTTPSKSDAATAEPIKTWPQWRDQEAATIRREHSCTAVEARQAAGQHRRLWGAYVVEAFEAGRDFTPRAITELPAYLLHRMTGTPRWQNREMGLHPDANPLRRYMDRLTVLNTTTH